MINPQVAVRMVKEIKGSNQDKFNPFVELTERELDVLRMIRGRQEQP